MGNKMNQNYKKEVTITIRCSVKSKEQLKEKADRNGMTLSRYLLNTGIAGLESKQNRKQKKVKALVKLTQPVNDYYDYLQSGELDGKVLKEKFDNVMKGMEGLWEN